MSPRQNRGSKTRSPRNSELWRKFGRGFLYVAGIATWGIAVGGVGRLCAFIISEIREQDWRNTAIVYDPASRSLRVALLLSEPLEGVNADVESAPTGAS